MCSSLTNGGIFKLCLKLRKSIIFLYSIKVNRTFKLLQQQADCKTKQQSWFEEENRGTAFRVRWERGWELAETQLQI